MPAQLITGTCPALEDALADAVRTRQRDDPLAAVHILVGGTLLRPYLRRVLAEKLAGAINVHLLTPGELGLLLGEPTLLRDGRLPLPMLADRVFTASAAASHPGAFADVAELPGFSPALARTLRDVRFAGVGPDALSAVAAAEDPTDPDVKRLASLAELHRRTTELRGGRYGAEDALMAADPAELETGLIVYGVWETTAVLRIALSRIAAADDLTVLLPATEAATASAVENLRRFLVENLDADTVALEDQPAPATIELVTAPDPARETKHVVRQLLAWADEGIAFHEMAVAYREGSTYRPLIEAALREADIPAYVHEGTPLTERPLGRRILALLELAEVRDADGAPLLARSTVLTFLADARLPAETFEQYGRPSIPRWETMTRRAGVTEGLDSWQTRLAEFIDGLRASAEASEDPPEWIPARIAAAQDLVAFVEDLHAALTERPQTAPWATHVAWLDALLERYIADADPVRGAIAELGRLDDMVEPTGPDGFDRAVTALLEGLRDRDVLGGRAGAFGLRGVNVLDVVSLRQLGFRAVAVVGLSERSFPPPPREDPLLLDDRRAALLAEHDLPLPLRARGGDPEPLQFESAVAAAGDRLLATFARAGGDGRGQLPSTFFRSLASRCAGRRVTADEIDTVPLPGLRRLPAGRIGPIDADSAITASERRRALLEDGHDGAVALVRHRLPRTALGALSRNARGSGTLTSYDGALSAATRDALRSLPRFGRLSPTALESYAECPHRHLLSGLLGLRPIEEPEDLHRLSALDKGRAVHTILERFMRELPPAPRTLDDELARLRGVAQPVLDALHTDGRTGYPLLWEVDRLRIEEDLEQWLRRAYEEKEFAADWPQRGFEVRFGPLRYGDPPPTEDPLTTDSPLTIALPSGTSLELTGAVDRVDYSPATGRFEIVDYKTGSMYGKKPDQMQGGRTLQLPLYVLAIAGILDTAPEKGSARYESVDRRGDFRHVGFDGALLAASDPSPLVRLLDELVHRRQEGDFHREPGESEERGNCRYCSVKGACEPRRRTLHVRKQHSAEIVAAQLRAEAYP